MRFELFVALRYLRTKRRDSFVAVISLFSVLGVGLGVASLIVVLGVMSGFSTSLRDKILGVNAHAMIMSVDGGIADPQEIMDKIRDVPGVVASTPFIYSELMVSTATGVKGLVVRGIDPETAPDVIKIDRDMIQGRLADLRRTPPPANAPEGDENRNELPGIIIGKELAHRLGVSLGGQVNLLSPSGRRTQAGFTPRVKVFVVKGIFKSGMFEYDSSLAYIDVASARELLGFKDVRATGVEIRADNVDRVDELALNVRKALGFPYYVRHWMEMNQNLFAALKLEKTAMFVILVIIVLVGSFSIVTSLVMLVMEKTQDIAVLMSLGATKETIRRIFMAQGVFIGLVGTLVGYVVGIGACLALRRWQFIKLPEDVYALDHLPVRFEPFDMALIGLISLALCFLATLYPSAKAARMRPADALRWG